MYSRRTISKFSKRHYYRILHQHRLEVEEESAKISPVQMRPTPPTPEEPPSSDIWFPEECVAEGGCIQGMDVGHELNSATLMDDLRLLIVEFNPCRRFVTCLLKVLKKHVDEEIFTDKRTLLQTPRLTRPPKPIDPGHYIHIGIEEALKGFPDKNFFQNVETLEVNIGIDGCPLAKSGLTMWPILGAFPGKSFSPFLIGIYAGIGDPSDVQLFLEDLVEDIKSLEGNGIAIDDGELPTRKPFRVKAFIVDSKARSFLTGVIGHTGHLGCGRCYKRAKTINGRVTFPVTSGILKTDESFGERRDDCHKFPYPFGLENAGIKMVSQFPLCSMHLIYLGVLRTLGVLWSTPKSQHFKLSTKNRKKMNALHLSLTKNVPMEFSRKPDDFRYVKKWKATQCRQLLLYTGMVVLKDVLDKDHYAHFLLLSVAVRILSSEAFVSNVQIIDQANEMLQVFVKYYPKMYGVDQVVYNVHNLLHLTDCVHEYGVLENFSAFPFENFLQILKKKINPCAPVIPQVLNRIEEEKLLNSLNNNLNYLFTDRFHLKANILGCNFMYKTCKFNQLEFRTNDADRYCVLKDQTIIKIQGFGHFNETPGFFGRSFRKKENFFKSPVESRILGIFLISDLSPNVEFWVLSTIHSKLFRIPYGNASVVIPLLHTREVPSRKTINECSSYPINSSFFDSPDAELDNIPIMQGEIEQEREIEQQGGIDQASMESSARADSNRHEERLSRIEKTMEDMSKKIEIIYKHILKEKLNSKMRQEVLKALPIDSVDALKAFESKLKKKEFSEEFASIAGSMQLRDFLKDKVVKTMNLKGSHDKEALKNYGFYKIWKNASGISRKDFKKMVRCQIQASHSRIYAKERRLKMKSKGRPVIESDSEEDS
ncbi:uncharacterized protein LOC129790961 isoform X1 [Lutzomyia longipalpis]|uniref:uncharacterized protein LOC129790961 isoform X1 n=1 Tax=Lutzomyia longipalpis TaxID=7200 RepID=UPI0024840DF8|nr:uncharacterized protein LOC129790961 isoform X1 [Lutzomyia longipalpis]